MHMHIICLLWMTILTKNMLNNNLYNVDMYVLVVGVDHKPFPLSIRLPHVHFVAVLIAHQIFGRTNAIVHKM